MDHHCNRCGRWTDLLCDRATNLWLCEACELLFLRYMAAARKVAISAFLDHPVAAP